MHKKHSSLLTALLLVSSFDAAALGINGSQVSNANGSATNEPVAKDDYASVIIGVKTSATGNVSSNDLYGSVVSFNDSTVGKYGYLELPGSSGLYTYKLFDTTDTASLSGGTATDSFSYTYSNETGDTDSARLIVEVNPDPTFSQTDDQPYDNVDVEFNDRSADATPLNSGRNIKGHLHTSSDKDWFALASEGDEIITLEVCPKGSSCSGKKSWVLYVFDSDKLTPEMEKSTYLFKERDENGQVIGISGESNHMYLAYDQGFFEGALIGVVDPCFGDIKSNSVDIGVGPGARNYLIAISSPLQGGDNQYKPVEECGTGSIVLRREAAQNGTAEYISVFPNSDDQYAIKITGTGINPLLSNNAKALSSSFDLDTETLGIPKIRIGNKLVKTTLTKRKRQARSADNTLEFIISDFEDLGIDEFVDAYRATYNPENQQVLIPRVTVSGSGKAYSVILQYHAATNGGQAWLDVISAIEIL